MHVPEQMFKDPHLLVHTRCIHPAPGAATPPSTPLDTSRWQRCACRCSRINTALRGRRGQRADVNGCSASWGAHFPACLCWLANSSAAGDAPPPRTCAAVSTSLGSISVPPQKWMPLRRSDTI